MNKVDLTQLTAAQKAELFQQLEAEEKAEKERLKREKQTYEQVKDETVKAVFLTLERLSSELQRTKEKLLAEFDTILRMKEDLYGVKDGQQSHQFTTIEGDKTIITGFNTIDRWDESVSAGLELVNMWINKFAGDENTVKLVGMIRELLKPNKDGVLKASRILDLQNQAEKIGDKELIEAVKVIREAHRPDRTSSYIKAQYKDENGNRKWLGLSMSQV
jgi:hypothetical protein